MSKAKEALIHAFEKGYRIVNGIPCYNNRELNPRLHNGYYVFSVRHEKKVRRVPVHRLVAYQKFGDAMFAKGIEVRHLDSNSMNNLPNNIAIGTKKENMGDKNREMVLRICSEINRKHDHEAIIKMKKEGFSYKDIMQRFGIKSKGTISYIINSSNASCV